MPDPLTTEEANTEMQRALLSTRYHAVYDALVRMADASERMRDTFVSTHMDAECPCKEWRFGGKLGFGGKYRSKTNTVDCYSEDENPARNRLVVELNRVLAERVAGYREPTISINGRLIAYFDQLEMVRDFEPYTDEQAALQEAFTWFKLRSIHVPQVVRPCITKVRMSS